MKVITAHVEMHVLGDVDERDVRAAITEALDEMVFDLNLNVLDMSTVDAFVDGEEEGEENVEPVE